MNPRIMIPNISKCLALATELVIRSMGYKLKIQQALELVCKQVHGTGKSLSEALIFASTNPQYDDKLFIELQV